MKKTFIMFLMMSLMLGNTSAAWADSSSIELSLDNIKPIILENNLDMQTADNNEKKAEEDYNNLLDDVNDKEDEVTAKKTEISNYNTEISNFKLAEDGSNSDDLTTLKTNLKTATNDLNKLNTDLDTLEQQKTTKRYAVKTATVTYNQTVEKAVYAAQQDYINYLSILEGKETKENEIKSNERDLSVFKLKYSQGFAAKNDGDAFNLKETTLKNDLSQINTKADVALKDLKTVLGVDQNTEIKFDNSIDKDLQDILQINFDEDTKTMLENNFNIQLQNLSIDELNNKQDQDDSSVSEYEIDNSQISLEQKTIDAKTNFKSQYDALMTSYNTLKSDYDALKNYQTQFNTINAEYSYGFASKQQVDDLNTQIADQNSVIDNQKNQLYLNYLHYIQMKEGY
ncbi:hypothetical protein [Clostridium saccharobutylicum]|uniref:Outer membrane efflux protein n=1 Tax=Clostridium saccharobutylicum DSM 13864 TaxID=1345695 RepID=U5MQW1_CLOSA|nr:hypothetical protein [Clostridium saccharobutylicum]AGX42061.1 hypothetical protein CLSA_c10540 [Clostridium saccharobutylicum DSM 13864]AQR89340.1 hypothetical protein CLOSC_10410 [Clostridium saccharobutylicum]AQR99241.1 hypothetical protein CSACC_10480 [Clostridium saccharobutylicum]AQS08978.1 hypothetical protein CLOBY_10970 [Clostridium saccharobutylicum]AQS13229.1 hypothetical protein CLOSACC_10480 [Clostridium saccharobutylicum]